MKLVIGTAQLGENYGIAFPGKKIQKSEFIKILDLAQKNKIQSIDTAAAYGDSQEILGEIGINGMCVTTKLPKIPEDILKKDINLWLNSTLKKILDDLKLNTIDVLLIHYINDLLGKFSNDLIDFLQKIKLNNTVKKIGVSIYEPEEINSFHSFFTPDIIQCPYNIFDQRISSSGWLDKLATKKVEVHARSIFLQGVLLKDFAELDSYFFKWEDAFLKFENHCKQSKVSKLEAAIAFVKEEKKIKKILVGVESIKQFKEIIDAYKKPINSKFVGSCEDINLVNPLSWNILDQKI